MLLDLVKNRKPSLLDPLGLFHKEPQSTSNAHSFGSNLQLGGLSISSSIASSSATAQGNGVATSNANSQASGGASAKADASASAQGI